MRLILLASAALTLSACSSFDMFGSGFGNQSSNHTSAVHNGSGAYGVQQSNHAYQGHQTQVQNSYAYTGQAPSYGGPVHVNPVGRNQTGYTQLGHNQVGHGNNGAGVPALRGLSKINAGPRFYTNLGAILYDIDDEAFGIVGRAGVQRGFIGAEIEGSAGVFDDNNSAVFDTVDGPAVGSTSVGAEWSTAAFATARAPLVKRLDGFVRAGYHITEFRVDSSLNGEEIINNRVHSDGFAYGAGLEFEVDARRALRLDYTRYESDDFRTADSVSASFVSRF